MCQGNLHLYQSPYIENRIILTSSERHAVVILVIVTFLLAAFHIGVVLFVPDAGAIPYAADLPDGTLVVHTGTVDTTLITKTGGHLIPQRIRR